MEKKQDLLKTYYSVASRLKKGLLKGLIRSYNHFLQEG